MAAGGEDRPAEFAAGPQAFLLTFKRLTKAQMEAANQVKPKTRQELRRLAELQQAEAMKAEAAALVRASEIRAQQAQEELDRAKARLEEAEARLRKLHEDSAPDAAARRESAANLKQIGIALHEHHFVRTSLPPRAIYSKDGKALLSWRVAILPYLGEKEKALYQEFRLDEPWDSEHNKELLDRMPAVFQSPAAQGKQTTTPYQVLVGVGAPFYDKEGLRLTQFLDGTTNTILVVETSRAVPWTKPADLPFDMNGDLPKLGGLIKDGFQALMADGAVRYFANNTELPVLRAAITHAGGEILAWDKEDRPFLKR
jgi:hypothetical protein